MTRRQRQPLFAKRKAPQDVSQPKKVSIVSKIFKVIWSGAKRLSMFLGGLVLISIIINVIILMSFPSPKKKSLPSDMVLYYKLDTPFTEMSEKPSLFDPLPILTPTTTQLVRALDHAKDDARVKALVFSLEAQPLSMASIQEIRASVEGFKASGKKAYIIADNYGFPPGGIGEYYLASAFDEIWMSNMGYVSIPGFSIEIPYVGALLDKLGITPQFYQREEFKSAMEFLQKDEISPAAKRSLQAVMNSFGQSFVSDVSASRGLDKSRVETIINTPFISAKQAINKRLVDRLSTSAEFLKHMHDTYASPLVNIERYSARLNDVKASDRTEVAYITIDGEMKASNSFYNPYQDVPKDTILSDDENVRAIYDLANEGKIKALLIRMNSPGGAPDVAEDIRQALVYAQSQGVKVVVSMGDYAASGGYWAVTHADRIFAQNSTLTGSIGVVGGKIVGAEALDKLGVNTQSVRYGTQAGMWSPLQKFNTPQERAFNQMLDSTYNDFITRVADGRNMPYERAKRLAKGRVWTGAQAHELGLVDQIGGINDALDYIAQDLQLASRDELSLESYPKAEGFQEEIMNLIRGQSVQFSKFGDVITKVNSMLKKDAVEARMIDYKIIQ